MVKTGVAENREVVQAENAVVKAPNLKEAVEKLLAFALVIVVFLTMFMIYDYLDDWRRENVPEQQEPEELLTSGMLACIEMGCPIGTEFIGSKDGTLYHDCSSGQARSIREENRICFSSAEDAVTQGYRT